MELTQLPPQSVFFGAAILVSLASATWLSRHRGLDPAAGFGLFSILVVCAVLGARLMWIVAAPEAGIGVVAERPMLAWHPLVGGYASLGGWIGAGLAAWLSTWNWSWERRWCAADALVPSGLAGMAIARLGCLSNGCDFGRVLAWGLQYPQSSPAFGYHVEQGLMSAEAARSLPTFPLPIVLAGVTVGIVVVSVSLMRGAAPGKVAIWSSTAYFGARLVIESFRSPSTVEMMVGPMNVNHLFALLGIVCSMLCLMWLRRTLDD